MVCSIILFILTHYAKHLCLHVSLGTLRDPPYPSPTVELVDNFVFPIAPPHLKLNPRVAIHLVFIRSMRPSALRASTSPCSSSHSCSFPKLVCSFMQPQFPRSCLSLSLSLLNGACPVCLWFRLYSLQQQLQSINVDARG